MRFPSLDRSIPYGYVRSVPRCAIAGVVGRRLGLARFSLLAVLTCGGAFAVEPALSTLGAVDTDEGFAPIFNGRDLTGWDGDTGFWRVEDGAITAESTPQNPATRNTFIIWRQGEVDDFELRLEFRLSKGNSGVQYRSWEEKDQKWLVAGYQADIEVGSDRTGSLYGEGGGWFAEGGAGAHRGLLAGCGEKAIAGKDHKRHVTGSVGDQNQILASARPGEWHEYRILAHGNHFVQKVNGLLACEFTDADPTAARRKGILALQLHSGEPTKVQFRNIRLKRLRLDGAKKVVFIAGGPSHGYASHAHYAGCRLLAKCLDESMPGVVTTVYRNGWPADPTALDNADSIVVFSDGQGGHSLILHLDEIDRLTKKGVGLALIHYAVEPESNEQGMKYFLPWTGGFYEKRLSVNPTWTAKFRKFPDHPIARGVKPFAVEDEWYYLMRFPEGMKGVTAILTDMPPDETRMGPDGDHSGNPTVRARKGMEEHVAWATERADGGRGFGFTGGHFHWNWGNDGFRTIVLNAIVWTAGLDVPPGGVPSKTPTLEDLEANQDYPQPKDFDRKRLQKRLDEWKAEADR